MSNLPVKRQKAPKPAHRTVAQHSPEWNAWVEELEQWRGHPVCAAKKRDGSPCTLPHVTNKTRCRMHGGASMEGVESASYKHGRNVGERRKRRARLQGSLPANLEKAYLRALEDPDLLNQSPYMALGEARVEELGEILKNKQGTTDQWKAVKKAIEDFRKEERRYQEADEKRQKGMIEPNPRDLLVRIEHITREWEVVREHWADINEQSQSLRMHAETEIKRLKELANTLPRDAAIVFAMALRAIVEEEVERDVFLKIQPRVLEALHNHLGHLMATGD